jgi:haloalkane dehalogenase
MWSFADDPRVARAGRLLGGRLGRLLYRVLNLSPRVILRQAWRRRESLTPAVHRHYLAPFGDGWSRERVLWTLARELLGSSDYYADLWSRREHLLGRPAAMVWGLADPAFRPDHLARWRGALPEARVAGLPGVGHWPQEEAPEVVARELTALLAAAPPRD